LAFFVFLLEKNQALKPVHPRLLNKDNYLELACWILIIAIIGAIFYLNKKLSIKTFIKKIFVILFPSAIATFFVLIKPARESAWSALAFAIYVSIISFYFLKKIYLKRNPREKKIKIKEWIKNQGKTNVLIVALLMISYLSFGAYNIGKFAAVDEALWNFGRTPEFWKEIRKANWNGTRISDKPGITVAMISGIGMLFENPLEFEFTQWNGELIKTPKEVEQMNKNMGRRIALFICFIFFLLYFFLFLYF